jgi:hypothetical protein
MAHQVNPTGFRSGKTFLWNNNQTYYSGNSQKLLNKNVNQSKGLKQTADQILQRSNFWVVKSNSAHSTNSGSVKLNILYYPLATPLLRKRIFPVYSSPRTLLNKPAVYNTKFKDLISRVWVSKNLEFNNRFVRAKKRKNFNKFVTKAMFLGSKLFIGRKAATIKSSKQAFNWNKTNSLLGNKYINYTSSKNQWSRWRTSKTQLSAQKLSKQLSKRAGVRVKVKLFNVFSYISKKSKKFKFKKHQRHIWNKKYQYNKTRFSAYYDIVNSLYLLCYVRNSEEMVLKMIQHGLINMHRRKIRPKNLFYFLNSIVRNMKAVQKNFNAFRLIITGKLRGGTARTQSFSTGFGIMPRQTIDKNISYVYGDVRSKYGTFGVKLFTWRKSGHETATDVQVKWTLIQQRRNATLKKLSKKLVNKKFKAAKLLKKLRNKFIRNLKNKYAK